MYDEFASKLVAAVNALKVGPGNADGTTCGPLINEAGVDKVAAHCEDAVSKGGTIHCGGHRMPELGPNFFAPTVMTDVPMDALVMTEETFGCDLSA